MGWFGPAKRTFKTGSLPRCRALECRRQKAVENMILYQFRKHLADEIRNFPVEPNAATESYAITTAALARKILDYLNARDLTVPNGFKWRPDSPPYKLGTVLDRIIHFRTFGQDAMSFNHPGKPDLVTLYSDKHIRFKEHMYIRLTDYREVISRLATDDLLVAHYLLRHAVTLLSKAVKTREPQNRKEEIALSESLRSIYGIVANALNILIDLTDAGKVEIPPSTIDCYEDLFDEGVNKYSRFPTCREFVDGYWKIWRWAPFNPHKIEIEGRETYCMPLDEIEPKPNGSVRGLVVPLDTFISLFTAVWKQIGKPYPGPSLGR